MSSYHGWTHAPKSQGGTDPIPVTGGGAPKYASLWNSNHQNVGAGSSLRVAWDTFVTNDLTVFGTGTGTTDFSNNTTGDNFVFIRGAGIYFWQARLQWEDSGSAYSKGILIGGNIQTLNDTGFTPENSDIARLAVGGAQTNFNVEDVRIIVPDTDTSWGYTSVLAFNKDSSVRYVRFASLNIIYFAMANTFDFGGTADTVYA